MSHFSFQKRAIATPGELKVYWVVEGPNDFKYEYDNGGKARAEFKKLDSGRLLRVEVLEKKT